ncbi:MAG: hypothetical protein ACT4O9_02680 [Blastocatellia bacterium]
MKAFLHLALLVLFVTFSVSAQDKEKNGIVESIYLAKDDGAGKAGEEAVEFTTSDIPIYCVVLLKTTDPAAVKMNLVAVSVPGVKAETRVVSTSYKTKDGENRVNFSGRPDGRWVAGKYRVDVFIDGVRETSLEFKIGKPTVAVSGSGFVERKPRSVSPPKPKKSQ